MSDLERLARAAAESHGENWDAKDFTETANGGDPAEAREYWRSIVRAVLTELREPSEAMIEAMNAKMDEDDMYVDVRPIWQSALDSILSRTEGR